MYRGALHKNQFLPQLQDDLHSRLRLYPNYLYYLTNDKPLQILKPGNPYLSDFSLQDTKLPAGHPEGIFDSMGNIYNGVAREINREDNFKGAYPTLDEGVRGMKFIEKVVESNAKGNIWLSL